jgi:hypothetical protein
MHLQIRSVVTSDSGGPGAMSAIEGAEGISIVQPGRLLKLLDLLARDEREIDGGDGHGPFNVRAASGQGIETTGVFAFSLWAASEEEEEPETEAAFERIRHDFPESRVVERQHEHLPDQPGALRDYVATFAEAGLLIDEIAIGVADCATDGGEVTVPVQIHALRAIER